MNSVLCVPATTWPATFTLKCQGNWCPSVSKTHDSHCSTGRRYKSADLVSLAAAPLNCTLWSLCRKSGPRSPIACRLGSPKLEAAPVNCTLWSPCGKSGPKTPFSYRLGSSVPGAAVVASSSQLQQARPRAPATFRLSFLILAALLHYPPEV
jgi:hypothetical protein